MPSQRRGIKKILDSEKVLVQDQSKLANCNENTMARTARNSSSTTAGAMSCGQSKSNSGTSRVRQQRGKAASMPRAVLTGEEAVRTSNQAGKCLEAVKYLEMAGSMSRAHLGGVNEGARKQGSAERLKKAWRSNSEEWWSN